MLSTLSKFLPPEVAQDLLKNGIDPTAEVGRRKELSILFSDIRGFTSVSEVMKAEDLVGILNTYLGKMTDIVFHNKGTLDKFIGDAVMAFWGAPSENPQHALAAVRSAFQMSQALKQLNLAFAEKKISPFAIGIGIHTGEVIVGNIGSEKRLDYTVIGDNVNLASRLEGLTKLYALEIVIGPRTYDQVKDQILCREVDHVVAKGKTEALRIYEPICEISVASEQDIRFCEMFNLARKSYTWGQFALAEQQFLQVLKFREDALCRVFLSRIQELQESPPLQWTGTYQAKSK